MQGSMLTSACNRTDPDAARKFFAGKKFFYFGASDAGVSEGGGRIAGRRAARRLARESEVGRIPRTGQNPAFLRMRLPGRRLARESEVGRIPRTRQNTAFLRMRLRDYRAGVLLPSTMGGKLLQRGHLDRDDVQPLQLVGVGDGVDVLAKSFRNPVEPQ